jgi:hypothetical protein
MRKIKMNGVSLVDTKTNGFIECAFDLDKHCCPGCAAFRVGLSKYVPGLVQNDVGNCQRGDFAIGDLE